MSAFASSSRTYQRTRVQQLCAITGREQAQQIGLYSSPHRSTRLYRGLVAIGCIALFTT
jgi:hypothetical protein